jgi:hypothetical protein
MISSAEPKSSASDHSKRIRHLGRPSVGIWQQFLTQFTAPRGAAVSRLAGYFGPAPGNSSVRPGFQIAD